MLEDIGLRERKKKKVHQAIIENAWKLFMEKGFENVKVSDIADAADISVKTLFTYFNSKEDILFDGEDELLDEIITAIRVRKPAVSVSDSITELIYTLVREENNSVAVGAAELTKIIALNPIIQRRLLVMWQKYENRLAEVLAAEWNLEPGDPRGKIAACNLILPFRMLFELKINGDDELLSNNQWLDQVMDIIKNGISNI